MFGTYRTLLALMVVAFHIGGVPTMGEYAVFGFYSLSGYLMTLIMHQNYHYTAHGIGKYALNRFLRIYPIYWVSILFSLLLIVFLGEDVTRNYHHAIFLPESAGDILKNLFLFFPVRDVPRLTPPAWALTVELFFYICIGLGLSKSRWLVQVWCIASVIYHVYALAAGLDFSYRYYTIAAASLPFSAGAMIYHYRDGLNGLVIRFTGTRAGFLAYAVFFLILLNWYLGVRAGQSHGVFFYVNFALCSAMVAILMQVRELPYLPTRMDKWLGDLSYPIYLIHYQVALMVIVVLGWLGMSVVRPDMLLMYLSIPVIILTSYVMTKLVELPIERIRTIVKKWE
jgi:peptidoglycan/LPS O-acetylase OafA/YrhL